MGVWRLDWCRVLELVGVIDILDTGEKRTGEAGMCLETGVVGDRSRDFCGVVSDAG